MTREEIIESIIGLLNGQLNGSVGYIGQEPYQGDFFKLFAAAYNGGHSLTADALYETIRERWFTGAENEDVQKQDLLEKLHSRWPAWQYAWDRCHLKT